MSSFVESRQRKRFGRQCFSSALWWSQFTLVFFQNVIASSGRVDKPLVYKVLRFQKKKEDYDRIYNIMILMCISLNIILAKLCREAE